MITAAAIAIKGKVQGVFFRKHAQAQAQAIGVTGFIRNEADGSVYIEVEGEAEAVKEFARWCRQGSDKADVRAVKTTAIPSAGQVGFQIK